MLILQIFDWFNQKLSNQCFILNVASTLETVLDLECWLENDKNSENAAQPSKTRSFEQQKLWKAKEKCGR